MSAYFATRPIIGALTLLISQIALAQISPDAGQIIQQLQELPAAPPLKLSRELQLPGQAQITDTALDDSQRLLVSAFDISGNTLFTTPELQALLAPILKSERSLSEISASIARITTWYRDHGYVLAQTYLPPQDIEGGVVHVKVLEGHLDKKRLSNQSRLADAHAAGYLAVIPDGDVLNVHNVDRAMLLLGDTPGVGPTRGTLQPGASVGTSELLVELAAAAPYTASLELDNYGSRYTGEYRASASVALNSPLQIGDLLSVRALTSGAGLSYTRAAYQIPLAYSGLRLGAALSDTHYQLGQEFAALNSQGSAGGTSVFLSYPVLRSVTANVFTTLTWERKQLQDQTGTPQVSIDKSVQLASLGISGNRQDAFMGGGNNAFELTLAKGQLAMDAASALLDQASAQSQGDFDHLNYRLSRLQQVSTNDVVWLALAGQQASKNLSSSEKFSLGGAQGVRAFPQGEGSGDGGWLATLELRHSLSPEVQALLFYDAGSVTVNQRPFAAGSNTREISGAGVGVVAHWSGLALRGSLAWRTTGGTPTSEPASADQQPRLWMSASKQF